MSREPPSEPDEMTLIAMNWTGGTTKWLKLMGAPDTYMLVGEDP